ncbi:MAG TPA: GTP 3',8-cyclase MoaA [Magnetospirillum sp.]|nr:GTP 3',8-cyclase MoaA [Magnetospirillum sp.]
MAPGLVDPFRRTLSYLRVSVTDRCDMRCIYCMPEDMRFLPREDVLTLHELENICRSFIRKGIRRVRLTGGEPLVRGGVMDFIASLGQLVQSGDLDELTLTTNGARLVDHAEALAKAGVRRVNVSLDSLEAPKFARITRSGRLDVVLEGVRAAKAAGLLVRINTVVLAGVNEDELDTIVEWCGRQRLDLALIETMPIGETQSAHYNMHVPMTIVRERLARHWTLEESDYRTGGPARYFCVAENKCRIGFITPMSHGFCDSCNRMRLTCAGVLHTCLGHENGVDLRKALRSDPEGKTVETVIDEAVRAKPHGHDFLAANSEKVRRHMNATGG